MSLTVKLFDSSQTKLTSLRTAFGDCSRVEIVKTDVVLYLKPPPGLDVIYLRLAAAERWGSRPLVHKSQILKTSSSDQREGLPRYIVTGTCLADDDPRGPIPEMNLLLSAVFQAIREFNRDNGDLIHVVGFWAVDFLDTVTPNELRMVLLKHAPELLLR